MVSRTGASIFSTSIQFSAYDSWQGRNGPACRTLCEETLRAASQFGRRFRHLNWGSTRGLTGTLNVQRPGCCDSARLFNAKRMSGPASGEVVIYIFLLDEHLDNSNGSVACLKGARLEQSQDCRRRESIRVYLLRAYALNYTCAAD
jgi:hypothetical protein